MAGEAVEFELCHTHERGHECDDVFVVSLASAELAVMARVIARLRACRPTARFETLETCALRPAPLPRRVSRMVRRAERLATLDEGRASLAEHEAAFRAAAEEVCAEGGRRADIHVSSVGVDAPSLRRRWGGL